MNGIDAINTSSFNSGLHWTGGAAPVAGNGYQTVNFLLRTPATSTALAFAGDSLEVQTSGEFRIKTSATVTVNNLMLDNASFYTLTQPAGGNVAALAGNGVTLNGTTTIRAGILAAESADVLTNAAPFGGTGGFTTTGSFGTIIFTGTNNFSGGVTVNGGTVLVNGIFSSSPVTITSGTLGGNGLIKGAVTNQAGGLLQPGLGGADTSTLVVSNALNLAGTTWFVINRGTAPNAGKISGITTVTLGGTLSVTNAGATLQFGDAFTLFSAASYTGSFATLNLPALNSNLMWSNNLAVNGTIIVVTNTTIPFGTWTNDASGVWSTAANWAGGNIANGTSSNAFFNTINITADRTVTLDASRNIGNLFFGDINGVQNWFLNAGGGSVLTMAVASGSPTVTVDNNSVTVNLTLAGTQGLTKSGGGTLNLNGTSTLTGALNVGTGTLAVSNVTGAGTAAALTVGTTASTAAVLVLGAGANMTNANLYLGGNATAAGAIFQSGGVMNQTAAANIADFRLGAVANGYGYYNFSGGTLNVNEVGIGSDQTGSVGVLDMSGGNYVSGGYITLARGIGTLGALNVSGGTMNLSGTVANSTIGLMWNGSGASFGVLNIFGSGSVIGPANATYLLNFNPFSSGSTTQSGVVNLNSGGTLQIGGVINSAPAIGTSLLNFNGGTLKAQVANATFIGTLSGAYVYPGGAVIDDNGAAITIMQPLLAPVGYGVGVIPLTNGGSNYIGAPFVLVSGGGGTGATAIAQVNFATGQITNILITSPGSGYANTDTLTVTLNGGGGGGAVIGTISFAANTSGGLTKNGAGALTLPTTNTFVGKTIVNNGTLLLSGAVAGGAVVANGATLMGNGRISGALTNEAGGTLQPGLGNGDTTTLTVGSNDVLAGTNYFALNRINAQTSSRLAATGTLTLGGTLAVTNAGAALQAGDSFTLFTASSFSGSFAATNLPALGTGLVWTNTLAQNGILSVVSYLPPTNAVVTNLPATQIFATSATLNGQVVSTGGQAPSVWIYYGTNNGGTNLAAWTNNISLGARSAAFNDIAAGLATNTTYYFTALASNAAGISWATPSQSFTTLAANPSAVRVPMLTYHNDNTRQGQNTNETLLTLANVNTNTFGKLFSYAVNGYVYTQPLIMTNLTIPGLGVHNVVFVATEHDTVYAFDADDNSGTNGGLLWSASLGAAALNSLSPYGRRYTGVNNPFTDITPEVGATGTPVIDPATGTLYVNAFTREVSGGVTNYLHRIHALDVTTGAERSYSPVVVAGSVPGTGVDSVGGVMTFNAMQANQRPALTLAGGKLYVAYAGYADTDPYHGWLFGYNATNLTVQTNYVFNTTPNANTTVFGSHAAEGGIWQGGGGLCVDTNNNLFFETGNGSFSANTNGGDYADTFMKMSTTNGLAVADYFTPYDQATLQANDTDLGSCGSLLLPDSVGSGTHPHLLAGMGKSGKLYVMDRDTMTTGNIHYQTGSDNEIITNFSAVGGTWCPPSYWNGNIYCQPSSGAMRQFSIANGAVNTTATAIATNTSIGIFNGGPVISANGNNNGIVWVINANGASTTAAGTLYALNATNIAQVLYSSALLSARDSMGDGCKMTTPTVAGGKVYVPAQYTLSVYGLSTFLPAPTILPVGGMFTNMVTVSLADAVAGAAIYYTLDGSAPTDGSTPYTGPFVITTTTKVQAIAALSGYVNSAVTAANFVSNASLPPPPWQTGDIGSVAATGSAIFSNGVFIVTGSGADIWNSADGFQFVYLPLTNNCDISARVTSQGNTDPWAKAGVMIRDSLGASAAYGCMVITPGNGFGFQYRSQNGIASDGNISGGVLNAAPNNWVRLTRTNNLFTGYASADGVNWTMVGSPTNLTLTNNPYYVGLAITAHNDGALSTATLDNVTVNGFTYSNPPPAIVLTAPAPDSIYTAAASLTVTADADALYDTITAVTFYANTTFIGSVSNVPYALTATGLGEGSYALKAVAVSSSGLSSTSAVVNVTITATSGQPYGLTSNAVVKAFLNMPTTSAGTIPALVSLTGIFSNTPAMVVTNGLTAYNVNTPLWSDGALKTRYFAVPNNGGTLTADEQIAFAANSPWTFPAGSVFVKTFELNTDTTNPNVKRRLETRVLVRDINGAIYGVTYKWRADNSDADLLASSLTEAITITNAGSTNIQAWTYPSPSDCLTCHTPVANYVLGLNTRQLNGNQTYAATGVTDNQLRTMNRLGMFNPAFDEAAIAGYQQLAALTNLAASFEQRARSYLDANCAQCHQPGGSGPTFDARYPTPLASQNLVYGGLDDNGFAMIVPKDLWRSEIPPRMNTTNNAIKMPPLARSLIDSNAVQVMTDWINSLPGTPAQAPPAFAPGGGNYFNSVAVALVAPDTNAVIYYTLDGSTPTTNSLLYAGPFNVTVNATLAASAFRTNYNNSVTATALFFITPVQFTAANFATNQQFELNFLGAPGSNYVLQASTNLSTWTAISTNTATTNAFNLFDPMATNFPSRFYRVLQQ